MCLELLILKRAADWLATKAQKPNQDGRRDVNRPRAADDFAAIRARMEELRREREGTHAVDSELERDLAIRRARTVRSPETITVPGQGRQSGPKRS
jgi:hypothetical protein